MNILKTMERLVANPPQDASAKMCLSIVQGKQIMCKSFVSFGVIVLVLALAAVRPISTALADQFPDVANFSEAEAIPGIPSTGAYIALSSSGDFMVFVDNVPHRLFTAEWSDEEHKWTTITSIPLGSSEQSWESSPSISPDGQWLYYITSNGEPGGLLSRRKIPEDGDWTGKEGEELSGEIQRVYEDSMPDGPGVPASPIFDGESLYFSFRLDAAPHRCDIYRALLDSDDDTFSAPIKLSASINDGSTNLTPFAFNNGNSLLFARYEENSLESIYLTTWDSDVLDWSTPVRLGEPLNTDTAADYAARYYPNQQILFFNHWDPAGGPLGVSQQRRLICPTFTASDFESPMGKSKKIGSTLPVKFQLFFEDIPVVSQPMLDEILQAHGCGPNRPEILLYDASDEADLIGIELPEDGTNVGEAGDLGYCFRFDEDGKCIYNLQLDWPPFTPNGTYWVEAAIGQTLVKPGNYLFQTK